MSSLRRLHEVMKHAGAAVWAHRTEPKGADPQHLGRDGSRSLVAPCDSDYIVHAPARLRFKALSGVKSTMDCSSWEDAVSRFQRHFVLALMMLIPLLMPAAAAGPPPSAQPGTICITPKGWCPAVKPGPPGAPCAFRRLKDGFRGR